MSQTLTAPQASQAPRASEAAKTVTAPTTVVSDVEWTVAKVERLEVAARAEIIEGVLYMTAMPAWPHGLIVSNLFDVLSPWARVNRSGRVLPPQNGIHLSERRYLDPDLVYLRREQLPRKGGRVTAAALAVEVLSPSNLRAPREERERLFAQAGVEELWYVDYEQQRLEIRRLAGEEYRTAATFTGEATVTSELFPGLEFPLSAAWEGIED